MADNKPLSASALLNAKKRAVFRFIGLQLVLVFLLSLGIFVIYGGLYAYSFLAGALASVIPSLYMAWRVFGHAGTRAAKDVVRSFYRGEAGKLVLTALLLTAVFIFIKPLAARRVVRRLRNRDFESLAQPFVAEVLMQQGENDFNH